MGKVCAVLLLICSMVIAVPPVKGISESTQTVEEWFLNLPKVEEKVTKLHFNFHDQISGKNPTAVKVAQPNVTAQLPNSFGLVVVIDDALTVGPEPNSTTVGRARGFYASVGLKESAAFMTFDFVFTGREYNGSTLSVLCHNPVLDMYRELPIVGGSGIFRLARGIATTKTYSFNTTTGDATTEYNVIVLHY